MKSSQDFYRIRTAVARMALPGLMALGVALVPVCTQAQMEGPHKIPANVRSISITATDRVTQEADVATVTIGYLYYAADKDAAYAKASKASNAIIDALRTAGVAKDAIESQQQSIAPTEVYQVKEFPADERASHAFTASQSWTVRSTGDDAARVLDLAVKAGANKSGNIDWSLKDPNAASAKAAAKALQRARMQAAAMAAGLGVKLGELLYASNTVEARPVRPVMALKEFARAAPQAQRVLAINPRQIETSATVRAVFAME